MEVIRIENLSKLYDLGQVGTGTISKDLNRWWANVRGKEDPYSKIGQVNDRTKKAGKDDSVWALKDINFSVNQGEVVGIIGRNGAGKSTLLKIISRITTPTSGAVKVKGRIASLLEVGTGFHPEMTGRENIFMNGTLLGMRRAEIQSKLDEIIDFAGVEMYIDTPVKRYSSGMQVRLGFAVAAFLEPEILIVDEVLAVGDAEFQKKAIGRMQDVSRGDGRTILFVSHNMGTILQLCSRSILLNNGQIEQIGQSSIIIENYYSKVKNQATPVIQVKSNEEIYFKEIFTCNSNGEPTSSFSHSDEIHLRLKIGINKFNAIQNIGIAFLSNIKTRIFTVNKSLSEFYKEGDEEVLLDFIIEGGLIAPMDYSFVAALNNRTGLITYDYKDDICGIKVYDNGTDFAFAEGFNYGCIIVKDKWNLISN